MDIKKKKRGTSHIFGALCFILLSIIIVASLSLNQSIKHLDEQRNLYFNVKEQAKEWVPQEVINYLSVVDEETWNVYSSSSNLDSHAISQIYGHSYDSFNLTGVTEYMILDTQYTMDSDTDFKVYVNTILTIKDTEKSMTFIATIKNSKLYSMEAY